MEGNPIVDVVFKEGWTIPDSPYIKKVKGEEIAHYFMFFSEEQGIGLDELLAHVQVIISANQEREKKHALLKETVEVLKKLFREKSYDTLLKLRFVFSEDDLIPSLSEMHEEPIQSIQPTEITATNVPINNEMTDEDVEMEEEEKRAENFRRLQEANKLNTKQRKVELPPKPVEAEPVVNLATDCVCGPDEACEKCIDSKGY
jgi:hypothetical protein